MSPARAPKLVRSGTGPTDPTSSLSCIAYWSLRSGTRVGSMHGSIGWAPTSSPPAAERNLI